MADLQLPDGYHRVPATDDIAAAGAAHMQSVFLAESGRPFVSEEDYANFWRAPFIDKEQDIVLVRDAGGDLVAQALVMSRTPHTDPSCFAAVSRAHYGRGLGSALLAWEIARGTEHADAAPKGARVVMQAFCDAAHEPSVQLLTDHDFAPDRFFMTMEIEFDGAPPAARFPEGLELRDFTPDQLEDGVRTARDAFQDHYGYVERPLEDRLEEMRHAMEHPLYDPTLWWHLYDGDEMVANLWCLNNHEGDRGVGYVQSLGVRKPWRGRGLGKNLLLHCFGEFHRRGMRGAALDVDVHSLTGATRLYEAVGMSETHRSALYLKELRAGEDLAIRTL